MSRTTKRILCYGDSLTAGFCNGGYKFTPYANFLKDKLQALDGESYVEVDYYGFSGWTTKQLLDNAHKDNLRDFVGKTGPGLVLALQKMKYDLVILMAGTVIVELEKCLYNLVPLIPIKIKLHPFI